MNLKNISYALILALSATTPITSMNGVLTKGITNGLNWYTNAFAQGSLPTKLALATIPWMAAVAPLVVYDEINEAFDVGDRASTTFSDTWRYLTTSSKNPLVRIPAQLLFQKHLNIAENIVNGAKNERNTTEYGIRTLLPWFLAVPTITLTAGITNSLILKAGWEAAVKTQYGDSVKTMLTLALGSGIGYTLYNVMYAATMRGLFGAKWAEYQALDTGIDEKAGTFFEKIKPQNAQWHGGVIPEIKNLIARYNSQEPEEQMLSRFWVLYGLAGTGKSALSMHIATLLGAERRTYRIHASKLGSVWKGGAAEKVRTLLSQIETMLKKSPTKLHVIIIEEIESLLKNRFGSHENDGETAAAFLGLLDKLAEQYPNIVIVGSTNSIAGLDQAIGRRFELVELHPSPKSDRAAIFKEILKKHSIYADDEAVEFFAHNSQEFPASAITKAANTIITMVKSDGISRLTLNDQTHKECILQGISQEINSLTTLYKTSHSQASQIKDEATAEMYKKKLEQFEKINTNLLQEQFFIKVNTALTNLKSEIKKDNPDVEEVIKQRNECKELVEKYYDSLEKTPEQKILQELYNKIDSAKTVDQLTSKDIKKMVEHLQNDKDLNVLSLSTQITLLGDLKKHLNTLVKNQNDKNTIITTIPLIKNTIADLKKRYTLCYLVKDSIITGIEMHHLVNIEKMLEKTENIKFDVLKKAKKYFTSLLDQKTEQRKEYFELVAKIMQKHETYCDKADDEMDTEDLDRTTKHKKFMLKMLKKLMDGVLTIQQSEVKPIIKELDPLLTKDLKPDQVIHFQKTIKELTENKRAQEKEEKKENSEEEIEEYVDTIDDNTKKIIKELEDEESKYRQDVKNQVLIADRLFGEDINNLTKDKVEKSLDDFYSIRTKITEKLGGLRTMPYWVHYWTHSLFKEADKTELQARTWAQILYRFYLKQNGIETLDKITEKKNKNPGKIKNNIVELALIFQDISNGSQNNKVCLLGLLNALGSVSKDKPITDLKEKFSGFIDDYNVDFNHHTIIDLAKKVTIKKKNLVYDTVKINDLSKFKAMFVKRF